MRSAQASSEHPTGMLSCYCRQTKLWEGNVFTGIYHSVHMGKGHVWQGGACMAEGGMYGREYVWLGGACIVGGMCGRGYVLGGHVWQRGVHGLSRGAWQVGGGRS